jgi:DNA invertase Pin-like site-specific DNA recombinase
MFYIFAYNYTKIDTMKIHYVRISHATQNADVQINEKLNDYEVFSDIVSGSIAFAERPKGAKIIELIKQGKVEEILIHDISRIGRNNLDILKTIEFFTQNNVNLISKREGLHTIIDGKPNAIATLIIGILSTLAQHERERLLERQKEGIQKAKERGTYANNGGNRKQETIEEFFAKSQTKKIVKYLKQGNSLRSASLLSSCSLGKVQKVARLLKEMETKEKPTPKPAPLPIIDNEPKETKAKKKEIALQVYAEREAIRKQASEWLNINKVETPKTILNETEEEPYIETEEEKREWERMEREANK